MKTVIEMMRESHLDVYGFGKNNKTFVAALERYTELVRADEFEACARLCDARVMGDNNREDMEAKRCAADIRSFRARGNK